MPGIFINFRHEDTQDSAARLGDWLKVQFGDGLVFIDFDSGTPAGGDYAQTIKRALDGCDVFLVLIGPTWTNCKRKDGSRSLDAPDDWVRTEIAMALQRGIWVVPVLVGGARLPDESELPDVLRPMLKNHLATQLSVEKWQRDVDDLVRDLINNTPLKVRHEQDVATATTGLKLLSDLMTNPTVADTVGRSKEAIAGTYRQLQRLRTYKILHDALHKIEKFCLTPIQASAPQARLRRFRGDFSTAARDIADASRSGDLSVDLREEIEDQVGRVTDAFNRALSTPGKQPYEELLCGLKELISGPPSLLSQGIAGAAVELRLDRLVELMTAVRGSLSAATSGDDPKLQPFVNSIDSIDRLRGELSLRVEEHSRLQCLDRELRSVCESRPGALTDAWLRIKRRRSRLVRPFSSDLDTFDGYLITSECEIEAALARGDEQQTLDLLGEYLYIVSSAFAAADGGLLRFCRVLGEVGQPLKTILDLC